MLLLQPLPLLVLLLSLIAAVHSVQPQDGRMLSTRFHSVQPQDVLSTRSYNPRLRGQAIMMMSKRAVGPFSVRWYNGKPGRTLTVNSPKSPPALLPPFWCLSTFSKTIARARRHICPQPGRLDEPKKYPASFGISYGRG